MRDLITHRFNHLHFKHNKLHESIPWLSKTWTRFIQGGSCEINPTIIVI